MVEEEGKEEKEIVREGESEKAGGERCSGS